MRTKREMLILRAPFLALAMVVGLTASLASGRLVAHALARASSPSSLPAATECEGDACSQVTVMFDEAKQQYRAQNNSTDRWARVTASNVAASAGACLAPGKDAFLALKSIAGAYHAAYAEVRCGVAEPTGPPDE
jgi:hypothetical protein